MAVVVVDGFDHFNGSTQALAKGWAAVFTNTTTAGRFAGFAARITPGGSIGNTYATARILPSALGTVYAGIAIKLDATGISYPTDLLVFRSDSTTNTVRLGLDSSFRLIIRNSAGTILCTGTTILSPNNWNYIELKATINAATGSVEARLNGGASAECSASSLNLGSTFIDRVAVSVTSSNSAGGAWFDDFYVDDAAFLGDVRVETLYPTANGASTDFVASAGSAYQCIDEAPASSSDYIYENVTGRKSTFVVGDLATIAGTVHAVQTTMYAAKTDSGYRSIAPVIRQSSVNYEHLTESVLGADYKFYTQIYNADPTGSAWTIANVNGNEYGVKVAG